MHAAEFVTTAIMLRMTFAGMAMKFELYHEDEWELQKGVGRGNRGQVCACKP